MDNGLEGAGALATATAAATVLDPPPAQTMGDHKSCLNCGAPLSGPYCGACGQKAHVHRSVLHAVEEFLHGIVHFDSKFWRTLPLLLFRPGKLTREYVRGRRARYVAPVALFLLTVFSMFLLFGSVSLPDLDARGVNVGPEKRTAAIVEMDRRIAALDRDIAAASADPARAEAIPGMQLSRAALESTRKSLAGETARPGAEGDSIFDVISMATKSGELKVEVGNEGLNMKATEALQNPEFVFYKMKQKGYKLSFLLVPLSLPWMILLFAWKRDIKVYDHVVFLLYSISFMSMLGMLAVVMAALGVTNQAAYSTLLGIVPIVHMFLQLKEGYALGWVSAAWRTVALSLLAVVTLAVYFIGILLLGLLD